jgi:hypothetical protein
MSALSSRFVVIAGVLIAGTSLHLVLLGDLPGNVPHFLAAVGVMFALYAAAIFLFARMQTSRRWLMFIVMIAVLCRVAMLTSTPSLSDDIYRYLWEGRVMQAGYNPFGFAPEAVELEFLRDANYERINHRELETIYPPLAQAVFLAGASIASNVIMQKVLFVLFDLATLAILILLLRARKMNPNLSVVYAWSPLVMLETAHSGHMDSIGIFFLVLALYAFEKGKVSGGMAAAGMSFLAKLLPVMLAPYFLFRRKYVMWVPVAIGVGIVGYLPFARAGDKLWSSLLVYGQHWNFNSLVYRLADRVIDKPDHIRFGLIAIVALFSLYQGLKKQDLVRYVFRVVGCALLLSPTIYPWYLCWIVPLLCFHRSRAWIYLTGAVVASYWVWTLGEWRLSTGFLAVEHVPFYIALAWEASRSLRRPSKGALQERTD